MIDIYITLVISIGLCHLPVSGWDCRYEETGTHPPWHSALYTKKMLGKNLSVCIKTQHKYHIIINEKIKKHFTCKVFLMLFSATKKSLC